MAESQGSVFVNVAMIHSAVIDVSSHRMIQEGPITRL